MGIGDRRSVSTAQFGRPLSPVSETDSESVHTTTSSELRPAPLNFSRPRLSDQRSSRNVNQDAASTHTRSSTSSSSSNVRSMKAFHEAGPALPDEPSFEPDWAATPIPVETPTSAMSDFDWDGQLEGLRPRLQPKESTEEQSFKGCIPYQPNTMDSGTTAVSEAPHQPKQAFVAELPGSEPRPKSLSSQSSQETPLSIPEKSPRILKRMSVDQQSSRLSTASSNSTSTGGGTTRAWEDGASHHTMSVTGNAAPPLDAIKRFNSSDYDISMLSEKEIAKLKKKGINPALYMEMKEARKGKSKWVGPLVGNTYIG